MNSTQIAPSPSPQQVRPGASTDSRSPLKAALRGMSYAEGERALAVDQPVKHEAGAQAPPPAAAPVQRQSTESGAPALRRMLGETTDVDLVRDLKYAIEDAAPQADGSSLITYDCVGYPVSASEAADLREAAHGRELELLGETPAETGASLEARVQAAIRAGDYPQMMTLSDAIAAASEHATGGEWLVRIGTDEVRATQFEAEAARATLAKHIPASVDSMTPGDVKLESLFAGFHIAADKTIADGLETGAQGSGVLIRLSRSRLHVTFNAPLEAKGPLGAPTLTDVSSVSLLFVSGAVMVDAKGPLSGTVQETMRTTLYKMLAGSGFEKAGYDPYADQFLAQRFDAFQKNLAAKPSEPDDDKVAGKDISNVYAGAQLKLPKGVDQLDATGTGLVVLPSSTVTLTLASGGTPTDGNLVSMKRANLGLSGAMVRVKGEDVMRIRFVDFEPGGKVSLKQFDLLGSAKDKADWESFLRAVSAVATSGTSGTGVPAVDVARESEATLVPGLAKHELEKKLGDAIREAVAANPDLEVSGKPLSELLGL